MIASALKAMLGLLPDGGIRALVDVGFARTSAQLREACADPLAAQNARLAAILTRNANTEAGRRLSFARVRSLDDWRHAPLCDWDDVAPLVDRMVQGERGLLVDEDPIYYATTSGTTGRRKLIPVTGEFVAECRVANRVLYRALLSTMPGLLRGKRLSMRSPRAERLSARAECGSITVALSGGVDDDNVLDAVPTAVFAIGDFHARYAVALRFALQEQLTVASAINPSTLALFADTLAQRATALAAACDEGGFGPDDALLRDAAGALAVDDDARRALRARLRRAPDAAARLRASANAHGAARMRDAFPALCGLVTWKGGTSSWWLQRLERSYGRLPTLDYGYAASEGCFGAPLSTSGPGDGAASLLLPHGHVIELLPEGDTDGTRALALHQAEPGQRYAVIVTTSAGLYRYRMHDVVEVVGRHDRAPLAVFRHKEGTMCSITGEKLGEAHVAAALATLGWSGPGLCMAPRLRDDGPPGYLCVVERDDAVDVEGLGARLDAALGAANEEYDAKRRSLRLGPVVVVAVVPGSFVATRRRRVEQGAPDAHVKLPLLSPDGSLLLALGVGADDARGLAAHGRAP
ncbi:MAG: GH3 auxin-responsive promoter family protein [Deltaproteobacteria bacterium]|nr:GH3 auxin-responsive promoter family protein [Deltaproteobacteria bacterium]